ncbi:MAG TPA: pyruvate kinase alpha/beta domain-containing protein [Candidatus Nanoarchaeia archaeon]|nr:pyruvate kinase alpha/beta domain-containing protein [Candidatus Nanoarchaeia archaeon]
MTFKEKTIVYFDKPGKDNTDKALDLAVAYANTNSIKKIIIASATGKSALKLKEKAKDIQIVAVTYSEAVPYKEELEEFKKNEAELIKRGIKVVRCTHAFSGISKSISTKFKTNTPHVLIAETLKLISEGTKVAVEASLMAADVGAVKKEPVLALGGTEEGIDTCLLVEPATTSDFFKFGILEIICIPRFGGLFHG